MPFLHNRSLKSLLFAAWLPLAACSVADDDAAADTAAPAAAPAATTPPVTAAPPLPDSAAQTTDLTIEVDTRAKQLHVMRAGQHAAMYGVAVGTAEWPTKTGSWTISQVVWNPEWTPPQDEEWARDEKPKAPGDPENPLGRVQLVYDPPRTIHGTNEPSSIGKAASHGSIRMRNEDAVALAKLVMEAAGAVKDSAFFTQVQQNRREKQIVDLPRKVPIRIH